MHEDYQHLPDRKVHPEGHAHIDRHMSAPIVADGLVVAVAGVANKSTAYYETDRVRTVLDDQDPHGSELT